MTRERIVEGLDLLVLRLANNVPDYVPEGWQAIEWAYVKGIASAQILRLRDSIVPRDTSQTSVSDTKSQT